MNAVLQTMQGMGTVRFVAITVVGILVLGIIGFLTMRLSNPVYATLYSNLTPDDSGSIVSELGGMGIPFEVAQGGTEIRIQSSEVLRVRMALAQKGIPSQGSIVGYEIFDREQALGTSNFVLNVNLLRALEGELGRTIGSLSSIKAARVHLVMPKRNLFERNQVKPSASVVLALSGKEISKEEAEGVKQVVSSAVPGLEPDRVAIIDSKGRVLARGDASSDSEAVSAANSEEARTHYQSQLKQRIESLLEQTVGAGKVQAQVTAELSFDRIATNSEAYDPDGQVARSTQATEEANESEEGSPSPVSVGNNLPAAAAQGGGGAGGSKNRTSKTQEVTNFEISKTVTNKISEVGAVKRLSIAVLVDGKYNIKTTTDADGNELVERTYSPRSDEELAQLKTLVENAVGYDTKRGDKIEVVNMPFNNEGDMGLDKEDKYDWIKRDLNSVVKTLVVGIVAILAIILVVRPLVNRAFDATTDVDDPEQLAEMGIMPGGNMNMMAEGDDVDLDMIQNSMDNAPSKRINDLIENNPEETLSVIRTWMTQR